MFFHSNVLNENIRPVYFTASSWGPHVFESLFYKPGLNLEHSGNSWVWWIFLEIEGSDSETETPIRIFENDDGCDDNDMIDGIEADLEIETGTKMCLVL